MSYADKLARERRTHELMCAAMQSLGVFAIAPDQEHDFHQRAERVELAGMADADAAIVARGILTEVCKLP